LRARRILTGRRVRPLWLHCLLAFPLATVPALGLVLVGVAVLGVFGIEVPPEGPVKIELTARDVSITVVVAPLVETFLLALGVAVLAVFLKRAVLVAAVSALLWGALHGLAAPFWFVGATWPFFVYSACFLAWCPGSFRRGLTAAFIPHALNNGAVIVFVALEQLVEAVLGVA